MTTTTTTTASTARRFDGKVVLVTGAASGIGRATAQRFASEGGRVVCADVNEAGLAETVAAITAADGVASAVRCDVSDPASAANAVAQTIARHERLNVLASVAGIGGFQRTTEATFEQWQRIIGVNLTGTFLMCQQALPHLLQTKGAIVTTASVAGLKSHPYAAAYCASKGGVVMLTRALAVEYVRKGVRVNCVCPGGVETPLLSQFRLPEGGSQAALMRISPLMDRMARPAEIASAIAYLASDEAAYVTGTELVVDGGMIA